MVRGLCLFGSCGVESQCASGKLVFSHIQASPLGQGLLVFPSSPTKMNLAGATLHWDLTDV